MHRATGWLVLGWVGFGAGAATALFGTTIGLLAGMSVDGSQCESCRVNTTALGVGLGVGLPVMIAGLVLVLSHPETHVSQRAIAPPATDARIRAPEGAWAAMASPILPTPSYLPLIQGRF